MVQPDFQSKIYQKFVVSPFYLFDLLTRCGLIFGTQGYRLVLDVSGRVSLKNNTVAMALLCRTLVGNRNKHLRNLQRDLLRLLRMAQTQYKLNKRLKLIAKMIKKLREIILLFPWGKSIFVFCRLARLRKKGRVATIIKNEARWASLV
jgi:hypothetical protein